MWVFFVQCLCVCWYKVGWKAHTDNFFFSFNLLSKIVCTSSVGAQTASARQRPRAAGCRRGLIGWEDESHQVLHINCWVIADTEIISSRAEAGGRMQENMLPHSKCWARSRSMSWAESYSTCVSRKASSVKLQKGQSFYLERKETAGEKREQLLGNNVALLVASRYPG